MLELEQERQRAVRFNPSMNGGSYDIRKTELEERLDWFQSLHERRVLRHTLWEALLCMGFRGILHGPLLSCEAFSSRIEFIRLFHQTTFVSA